MITGIRSGASEVYSIDRATIENIKSGKVDHAENEKADALNISAESIKKFREERMPQNGVILTDYNYVVGARMGTNYGNKYYSGEETLDNLVNTYKELYSEIEKGYDSGTRETYIADENSESGYRKLTRDEEIALLDGAYKNYAEKTEERYAEREKLVPVLEEYIKKTENISNVNSKAFSNAQTALKRIKNDTVPKDFAKKAVDTVKLFVSNYDV